MGVSVLSRLFATDLAVDLGTSNTLVFAQGHGLVLDEPSVVAIRDGAVLAAGRDAKSMIGREPSAVQVTRPMKHGVIAEPDLAQKMLDDFLGRVRPSWARGRRPRVVVVVPSHSTPVEHRAVRDLALHAGAREAFLVPAAFAAALGAGLRIHEAGGHVIVVVGGGTTEVALLSLSGIVHCESVRAGGDDMDEAIVQWMRKHHNLLIGARQAEAIKLAIGSAHPVPRGRTVPVKGRDVIDGLPKTMTVADDEVADALRDGVRSIVDAVRTALEHAPAEVAGDIVESGLVLAGGGALLPGLVELLRAETDLPVTLAAEPLSATASGAGQLLDRMSVLERVAAEPRSARTAHSSH
ncbi:MAG: rod shape-determining protein [Candidatus Rokubacteria bacterium]|nr:rod shape-determining protein [Candidatus Rokubacteria bacterium]